MTIEGELAKINATLEKIDERLAKAFPDTNQWEQLAIEAQDTPLAYEPEPETPEERETAYRWIGTKTAERITGIKSNSLNRWANDGLIPESEVKDVPSVRGPDFRPSRRFSFRGAMRLKQLADALTPEDGSRARAVRRYLEDIGFWEEMPGKQNGRREVSELRTEHQRRDVP